MFNKTFTKPQTFENNLVVNLKRNSIRDVEELCSKCNHINNLEAFRNSKFVELATAAILNSTVNMSYLEERSDGNFDIIVKDRDKTTYLIDCKHAPFYTDQNKSFKFKLPPTCPVDLVVFGQVIQETKDRVCVMLKGFLFRDDLDDPELNLKKDTYYDVFDKNMRGIFELKDLFELKLD